MSYIGNQPTTQAFVTDQFSGNGSTTVFTMSVAPATASAVLVAISGVLQDPSAYSVIGTTLTFSAAPPAGTGNISARYLGIPASNIVTTAYRTVTEFTATASQTTFLPPSYTVGYINVYRNGSLLGSADYTAVNGTTVVLAVGATVGDLVTVESFYVSSVINAIPAVTGSVGSTYLANGAATQAFLDSASGSGTGALRLPVGTTGQRPSGTPGLIRQNSTTGNPEWWDATTSTWLQFSQPAGYSVNYLVIAGGGGAGSFYGGGGGAGGLLTSSVSLSAGVAYTITIGAGGSPSALAGGSGTQGTNSSLGALVAATGGGFGSGNNSIGVNGGSGGSGGGSGGAAAATGGSGTLGQGFAGGNSSGTNGGGGGGSGGAGVNNTGVGGIGTANSITGSSVFYASGGAGFNGSASAGGGGAIGAAGTANSGGGGGAGNGVTVGGGGSGVVIISYAGSQRGTGGTVTSSGGYTIHTFTSSGTYNA